MNGVRFRDRRLYNIYEIKSESDIFEPWGEERKKDLLKPKFTDPFDHVYGLGLDHYNMERLRQELDSFKDEYDGDVWRYVSESVRVYEVCELSDDYSNICFDLMKSDVQTWFDWVISIPYVGIQQLCLQHAQSVHFLIEFMKYISGKDQYDFSLSKMAVLVIKNFIGKLQRIHSNVMLANHSGCSVYPFDMGEWENEAENHIKSFVEYFFRCPADLCDAVLYSMLSNFRFLEEKHHKFDGKVRDEFLAQLVEKDGSVELKEILNNAHWKSGRPAMFHKVFLYALWRTESRTVEEYVCEDLWKEIIHCMDPVDSYIHYQWADEQMLGWVCAKLLADSPDPISRLQKLLDRYHKRPDGWNRNYENAFRNRRVQYFLLSVGSMATEWLLREKGYDSGKELLDFCREKGRMLVYEYENEDADEYNFLQQFWSRYTIFLDDDIFERDYMEVLSDFNMIGSVEYLVETLKTFFENLKNNTKLTGLKHDFFIGINNLLEENLDIAMNRNVKFPRDSEVIQKKIEDLKEYINIKKA